MLIVQVIALLAGLGGHSDIDGGGLDADADVDVDTDIDIDTDVDVDTDIGFVPDGDGVDVPPDVPDMGLRLLSVRGVIAFFAVAGWVGVIADKAGAQIWLTILIAFACGFTVMLLMALLMRWLMSLQSDGTADIRNAIGVSGTVYLRVPAERREKGKVNIILQGSYTELDAVTDEKEDLTYGAQIVVIGVSGGNTLIVKKK